MDPLEIRKKNGYDEGDKFVTEETLRSIGFKECLDEVAKSIGWHDKAFKSSKVQGSTESNIRRGKGLACMIKATITPSISCAVVKLNEDASLSIYAGTVEMGQGSETVLGQIAGKELGIPLPKIQVLGVDTDVVPYDLTTSSSRSTFHMGKAVQLAAQDIMRQLKQIVGKEYGVPEDKISFADGRIRLPETQLDYSEVMFKRFGMQGGTLVGEGQVRTSVKDEFGEKSTSAFWFLAAGAAEVEVDVDTGKFKLIKYATAVDVGKALNPLGCRQQLNGAAITGMGQAMFEEIAYDNGQLINPNLVDYVLPSLGDMPSVIDPIAIEMPHKDGPFGAKGIGESALIPVAPAIANAIYDAVGVRIKDLPIKPEKIYFGLQQRKL
jgi:CO/xanthine dehydrogenase Mo-binding subunit